jgi:hypothetical protein
MLPVQKEIGPKGGRPPTAHHTVLKVIWFVLVTSCRWKDVPKEIGCCGETARTRLQAWERAGIRVKGGMLAKNEIPQGVLRSKRFFGNVATLMVDIARIEFLVRDVLVLVHVIRVNDLLRSSEFLNHFLEHFPILVVAVHFCPDHRVAGLRWGIVEVIDFPSEFAAVNATYSVIIDMECVDGSAPVRDENRMG